MILFLVYSSTGTWLIRSGEGDYTVIKRFIKQISILSQLKTAELCKSLFTKKLIIEINENKCNTNRSSILSPRKLNYRPQGIKINPRIKHNNHFMNRDSQFPKTKGFRQLPDAIITVILSILTYAI